MLAFLKSYGENMKKIVYLIVFCLLTINNSYALDACEVLNPIAKVSERIQSDVKGAAATLFRLGAVDGNVKLSIEQETTAIYGKHSDANKTVIKGKLIYLYCNVILNSDSLSDQQKLGAIRKLYTENEELNSVSSMSDYVLYNNVEYRLKSCIQISNNIKCNFSLKNTSSDQNVSLNINSYLVDSDSEKYTVSHIKFGKTAGKPFPSKLLMKDIQVPAELTFNSISSSGTQIPLIKFGVGTKYIEFRNVELNQS